MTTFSLGINTCFAVKRWPRPEDWAPVVAGVLGLDLVQHSLDLVDLDGPSEWVDEQAGAVRAASAAHGIDVQSTFTGLAAYSSNLLLHPEPQARERAERWYRRAIDFTAAVGAQATGGHVGAYSVADWRDATRRAALDRELRRALRRLCAHAHHRGLSALYVENLASPREPATMVDVLGLVHDGDGRHVPLQLCLDVGHQCVPGTAGAERDPYAWLAALGREAGMVQLQQSDEGGDHHWPFTDETNAVGRIDAARVLETLKATGADHVLLVLEVIPPFEADDDAVLADLTASVDQWRHAIARATKLRRRQPVGSR